MAKIDTIGRLKATERPGTWQSQGTSRVLLQPASSAAVSPEEGNSRAREGVSRGGNAPYVPVLSASGKPLMPCHPARARELVRKGRAVRRFFKGVFCIRLLDRTDGTVQPVACGIDPGSKKEGFSVKSEKATFLNVQADAVTWVGDAVEVRRNMRRARRFRKTPCRQPRWNRAHAAGFLPPSTKARWQWKLRIAQWLAKLYPISIFVVEDIQAKTRPGRRRWNVSFSPLEVGKAWLYAELAKLAKVQLKQGWDTKQLRDLYNLGKDRNKLAETFEAHCVDAWVLAASAVGGPRVTNRRMVCIAPVRLHRRQLHALQPAANGFRRPYGGTRSLGFKRGALVTHPKHGLVYVGGTTRDRISLHMAADGKRLTQQTKPTECVLFAYNTWQVRFLPGLKAGDSTQRPR